MKMENVPAAVKTEKSASATASVPATAAVKSVKNASAMANVLPGAAAGT